MKIICFNGKTQYKWSFSMAMLNYQRVEYRLLYFQIQQPLFGGREKGWIGRTRALRRSETCWTPGWVSPGKWDGSRSTFRSGMVRSLVDVKLNWDFSLMFLKLQFTKLWPVVWYFVTEIIQDTTGDFVERNWSIPVRIMLMAPLRMPVSHSCHSRAQIIHVWHAESMYLPVDF